MPNFISEDQIERALLQRLQHVCGFDVLECNTTDPTDLNDGSGRSDKREVLLPVRLKAAARRLNPDIPDAVVDVALAQLADRRQAMSLVSANREVDGFLRDGIPVTFEDAQGKRQQEQLRLIDFSTQGVRNNEFLAVSQLWVKCMKDHTLMQTIARANRVTPWQINGVEKKNGEIVDYYNVFRSMKKALKDYAQGEDGLDEPPVRDKNALFTLLDDAVEQALAYCAANGIPLPEALVGGDVFAKIGVFNELANKLLGSDEVRRTFYVYENTVSSLYQACKPEVLGHDKARLVAALAYLRGVTEALVEQEDIDKVMQRVGELLDESVVVNNAESFKAKDFEAQFQIIKRGRTWDLSKIDFDKLRQDFGQAAYKNIEIADLRGFIARKLELMLAQNSTRGGFAQRFQQIIDTYNAGGSSNEQYFEQLVQFTQDMRTEEERHVREGLTEDELEIFDLLCKDSMTQAETLKVKLAAKALLHRLQNEPPKVLVQDWYKTDQTRRIVRSTVAEVLDRELPQESYDRVLFQAKCDNVFHLVLDHAAQGRKWAA